jgi:uncharacterized membrane protein
MDHFREEVVTRRSKTMENVFYILANIVMVFTGLYALFMANILLSIISMQGFNTSLIFEILIVVVMIATAVLLFLYKDRIKTEYEYTFTNGILDFAQVYNNRKRKALGTMNVRNVDSCGMVDSGSFRRYVSIPAVKRLNWYLNRDAHLFYFFFTKNNNKTLIVLEPSEEMIKLIKHYVGQGKYQTN